jgi:hypothetical protein
MERLTLEVNDNNVIALLKQMETLNLVKVIGAEHVNESVPSHSLLRGKLKLSDQQYQDVQKHIKEIRSEWNKEF